MDKLNLKDNPTFKHLAPFLPLIIGFIALLIFIAVIPLFVVAFLLGLSAYPIVIKYIWPYITETLKLNKKEKKENGKKTNPAKTK